MPLRMLLPLFLAAHRFPWHSIATANDVP